MKLRFKIDKNILHRLDEELITSYSKNQNKCIFHCEHKWADIYKYALFIDVNNAQYIVDLGLGCKTKCVIPEEVLKGNYFSVSVFGDDRLTTTQVNILIQPSGFSDKTEKALESGNSTVSGNSTILNDEKIWEYNKVRCNRFEIAEHPYTYY